MFVRKNAFTTDYTWLVQVLLLIRRLLRAVLLLRFFCWCFCWGFTYVVLLMRFLLRILLIFLLIRLTNTKIRKMYLTPLYIYQLVFDRADISEKNVFDRDGINPSIGWQFNWMQRRILLSRNERNGFKNLVFSSERHIQTSNLDGPRIRRARPWIYRWPFLKP